METIKIGVVTNSFGIRGEILVKSFTDFDEERFAKGNTIIIDGVDYIVQYFKYHKNLLIVKLVNFDNINDILFLKGKDILVDKKSLHELPDGQYYHWQLVGLKVIDQDNNYLGVLKEMDNSGYQDLMKVETINKDVLIPFIKPFLLEVNLDGNFVKVQVIEGLI
ncbi:MAG: ribosome maturation factor RimM [Erysipelotrichaceae bacterium]